MAQTIPLSVPDDLLAEVRETAKLTHLSVQDVFRQSARLGMPRLREKLAAEESRITNVDPLPKKVLERIYAEREEDDEEGVQRFIKAQALGGED